MLKRKKNTMLKCIRAFDFRGRNKSSLLQTSEAFDKQLYDKLKNGSSNFQFECCLQLEVSITEVAKLLFHSRKSHTPRGFGT